MPFRHRDRSFRTKPKIGHDRPEWAVTIKRNQRSRSSEMGGHVGAEYPESMVSPKAAIIDSLKPVAFVDDYLPYMLGIHGDIYRAMITRETEGSPNTEKLFNSVSSQHADIQDFVQYWLGA